MEIVRQKNWLLIITGFLLISSALVLFVTARRNLGLGICLYEGNEYKQNELISDFEGRDDCSCSWNGDIVCDNSSVNMSYEDFGSNNLNFSYSFKNFLEKSSPDLTKVTLTDINNKGTELEIILEREAFCGEAGIAPTQIGLFKQTENSIVLTTVTNRDETLYGKVCVIGNAFVVKDYVVNADSFSILYQNESGQLYDLNACFFNGRLYGTGDVFKDTEKNELCTCEGPEVNCEPL